MNVSVVIPALNEAGHIAASIRSAIAAHFHEVIVVDGGSTDKTISIAADLDCHVLQTWAGRALQQNLGARHATGDVLLFLHADSRLFPGCLGQIQDVLADDHVLAGAFHHRIDARGALFRLIEQGNALRVRWFGMAYGDQGIFLRRDVFWKLGGFPDVRLMEDVLLMRRLRRRGRVVLLPGPLTISARRWRQQGIIRQTIRNWMLLAAASLGVSPNQLARLYPNRR